MKTETKKPLTVEEKKAILLDRIKKQKAQLSALNSKEKKLERKARTHALIQLSALAFGEDWKTWYEKIKTLKVEKKENEIKISFSRFD
jgi:predicted RNA-binding protein